MRDGLVKQPLGTLPCRAAGRRVGEQGRQEQQHMISSVHGLLTHLTRVQPRGWDCGVGVGFLGTCS